MFYYRLSIFRIVLLAVFLVFVGRLAYLQLFHGSELRKDSENNHLRLVRTPAPRGLILDRRGRVLATSVPGWAAWLVPGEVPRKTWPLMLRRLTRLGIYPDQATAESALEEYRHYPGYLPVRLASGMTIEAVSRLEEEMAFLPGVYLREEPVRYYPHKALASHLIGYQREIDAVELAALRGQHYRLGDYLGKTGIERAFEEALRGIEGGERVEVNAYGRVLRTLHTEPAQPGQSITLTIELDVQRAAERAIMHHRGAAVALDPTTGEVLALVSAPGYDLNAMSGKISPTLLAFLRGASRPEMNRVTNGTYPPGSVFKIITAAAALERGKVGQNEYFTCEGAYHGIHCWQHSGHGAVSLTEAIAQSCNVAFMKMAERVGIWAMANTAREFELGKPVGLSPRVKALLPGEALGILPEKRGTVPDPNWARRYLHTDWKLGDTLQVGIGQSSLAITPLQSARIIAAIANGGKLVHPSLVKSVGARQFTAEPPTPLALKPETLRRVARGLRAVVGEGTARSLDPALRIAGKTGTAQNPGGADHAWFVGYAPREAPKIAVAVLIEHGGHGGAVAAPIAEAIIRVALQGTKNVP